MRSNHPEMGSLRKLFGDQGWGWGVVAESHLAPEQEKPHSRSKAQRGLPQVQESVLLVCCLDVAEQETAQWVIFFALQQWITVPAASGGRCRERRGENGL